MLYSKLTENSYKGNIQYEPGMFASMMLFTFSANFRRSSRSDSESPNSSSIFARRASRTSKCVSLGLGIKDNVTVMSLNVMASL